ncbi:hypothetical protein A3860_33175 [Niastella vici]|uniref:Uncharacterized protein n=1 Tax=Niastella vici TaxID=1703345 RepID=A0A1V9FQ66_9BACT|nr:hypothetical protein [Niastella vici]OQP60519.1 hypothetical protein A3860_33175 [Niastella vici]
MKNNLIIVLAFLGSALLYASCRPQIFELGGLANKGDLKFTIAPSSANPNDIVLTSLTPNVTPYWVTPYGQSIKLNDTTNVPFPGTYKFVYGVESGGGLVLADTTLVTINTIDKKTVSDPMWIKLSGGLGNSKTWVLDLDAKGVSKYFTGPFYFGGTGWEWDPAFKDIPWAGVSAGDYGTMTFDLIGNANFKSDNKMFPDLSGTGKFMLYPGTNELATIDAQVLHDKAQGGQVANWNARMTVKTLTDSTMQLIAKKDANNWLVYNYITKQYYDTH